MKGCIVIGNKLAYEIVMNSVLNWLEDTYKKHPNKIAIHDKSGDATFEEYRKKSLSIARELILIKEKEKIRQNAPVVIFMEKSKEMLFSFMGVAYSGSFYSPIDVDMPAARVRKILEVLEPAIAITTDSLKDVLITYGYNKEIITIDNLDYYDDDEELVMGVCKRIIDTDLLYVLFTSGSTGTPKGVSINHRSVIDYIEWVASTFSISHKDSLGNQAPFYFDNSIFDIYLNIKTGASLFIVPSNLFFQPVPLLEYLKDNKISTIFWVPSALIVVSKLRALRNVDLSKTLQRVLFCGEVMPNKHLNFWRKYLPNIVYANLYGPTEITDACTYYIVDREFEDDEPLPIGFPMSNTDILVLNEDNKLVKKDEIGELCVRGTSLSMGYYRNIEKTNEVFVQNPLNDSLPELIYRTGDLVKYNEYGELVYISRKDYQIKHMGHRIELGEIENAVSSIPEIGRAACLYDDKALKIVLFVDVQLDDNYILNSLNLLLPNYMIPSKIVYMQELPLNKNGKIDRVLLKQYL